MPDALDVTYLTLVALAGAVAFWDAPVRLVQAMRRRAVTPSRRYHALNLVSILLLVGWAGALAAGWDRGLWPGQALPSVVRGVGLAVALGGLAYAVWARLVMGRSFAPTAAVPEDARVVSRAPFAHVRHPFYLGMWTGLAAGALALDSLATLSVALVLVPIVRAIAILEEEHLARQLGDAYRAYAARVPRFVPGTEPGPLGRRETR